MKASTFLKKINKFINNRYDFYFEAHEGLCNLIGFADPIPAMFIQSKYKTISNYNYNYNDELPSFVLNKEMTQFLYYNNPRANNFIKPQIEVEFTIEEFEDFKKLLLSRLEVIK